ncbi:MAG: hypothetical protein KKI12_14695 [Proteobacteria bacterium]|nr:hypothetical protein [Actinomycetota bacterium]MBU4184781.1 hypothetical protein [Pseudomonadota bacterium]MCG2759504.1 hypothetical protein [Desulfobacteraceae bacterium]MBU4259710.1 hypothetical protein [Pseudomonadota bacterium]MBU4289406.1 hypothetical protein [Pseudomonadota bacterium]
MVKIRSVLTIFCLCLLFGTGVKSYAQPRINTADLKEHIRVHLEKVKFKNPGKYQEMMQKTGGNIIDCLSCHVEVAEGHKEQ